MGLYGLCVVDAAKHWLVTMKTDRLNSTNIRNIFALNVLCWRYMCSSKQSLHRACYLEDIGIRIIRFISYQLKEFVKKRVNPGALLGSLRPCAWPGPSWKRTRNAITTYNVHTLHVHIDTDALQIGTSKELVRSCLNRFVLSWSRLVIAIFYRLQTSR